MAQVVEIPGVGRVEFPDGMSREDIAAAASRMMGKGQVLRSPRPTKPSPDVSFSDIFAPGYRASRIPGINFRNLFEYLMGPLPDRNPEAFARETLPNLGATAASAVFPPAAIARGLPLLSRLGRAAPGVAAAGAGGAAGGAAGGMLEGVDINSAAFRSGMEMAIAEGLGRGATGLGARLLAPAVGLLDEPGKRALQFARENVIPGEQTAILGRPRRPGISPAAVAPGPMQQAVQGAADLLIPSRMVTQRSRRLVTERVLGLPTDSQNVLITKLINADTSDAGLASARTVADKVAKRIGVKAAERLGFTGKDGPRSFLNRVFREGNPAGLRRTMGSVDFDEFLTSGIESLIVQSSRRTQGGRRVIDGEALFSAWEGLPKEVRDLYPEKTREAVTNFAAFARASQFVPEAAEKGVLTFGPTATTAGVGMGGVPAVLALDPSAAAVTAIGSGVAALTAKSLMNPNGLLNRYLTSERLGDDFTRAAGREITKLVPRRWLVEPEDDEEDDEPKRSAPTGGSLFD